MVAHVGRTRSVRAVQRTEALVPFCRVGRRRHLEWGTVSEEVHNFAFDVGQPPFVRSRIVVPGNNDEERGAGRSRGGR